MTVIPAVTTDPAVAVTMAFPSLPVMDEVREDTVLPVSPGGGVLTLDSPIWSGLEGSEGVKVGPTTDAVEVHMSPELVLART